MMFSPAHVRREKELIRFLKGRWRLAVLLILLFIVQFYITWKFASTDLNTDYIGYFVEPFIGMETHSLFTRATQYRPWIGYPLFLVPVFEIFGMTAEMLRDISVFFTALSLPMAYLAFREWFNPVRALTITLLPLTWTSWVHSRYNEMPIVLFFTFLTVYLFLRWFNTEKKIYIYAASFLSGFGFYIKANQLYTVTGLLAGSLTHFEKLKNMLDKKLIVYIGILFLIGVTPFILYTINVDFGYLNAQQLYPDYDDNLDKSVTEVRINQLKGWTEPELGFMRGWGEKKYHIFQLLFLTGLAAMIYTGNYFFVAGFLVVFLQFYYVPTDLNFSQIISIIPFYLFVIAGNFRILPERRWTDLLVLFAVLILVAGTVSSLERPSPVEDNIYAFTVEDHAEYTAVETSDQVFTNSYNLWLISTIDLSSKSILIHEGPEFKHVQQGFTYKPKLEYLTRSVENINSSINESTLILATDCSHESCTVSEDQIVEQFGEHTKLREEVEINSINYRVYETGRN